MGPASSTQWSGSTIGMEREIKATPESQNGSKCQGINVFEQLLNIFSHWLCFTQIQGQDGIQFAEIYYFFQMVIDDTEKSLAMVSMYSPPHAGLLTLSFDTLWSCIYQGNSSLRVIDAKSITAVIAMVPHQPFPEDSSPVEHFFVVEKPGLDVSSLGGVTESAPEEE
jgi:hypothetical protein